MKDKETILENIEYYTADELLRYVRSGIISMSDLEKCDPPLHQKTRKELQYLLNNSETNDWKRACTTNTREAYQDYLNRYPKGSHREDARNAMEKLVQDERIRKEKEQQRIEEEAWSRVNTRDKASLRQFIGTHPNSVFAEKAKRCLDNLINDGYGKRIGMGPLKEAIAAIMTDNSVSGRLDAILEKIEQSLQEELIEKNDLLDEIDSNNNFLNAYLIKKIVNEKHWFTYGDLENCGIERAFIEKVAGEQEKRQPLDPAGNISEVTRKNTTEIYFWGLPSSGKSCALGAILSVAGNGTVAKCMTRHTGCNGYDYMNRLPRCFQPNKVCTLPPGTPPESTYEMSFDLTDDKNKIHPITCIDFAGELLKCMYKKFSNKTMHGNERDALQMLTNVLVANRTTNRKMHFFVIEYGAEDRIYDGLPQTTYLEEALNYIKQTDIFKTSTDAIYLIVTKVDKVPSGGEGGSVILQKYIKEHYWNFYNGLKQICEKHQINGGKVPVLSFSLGKVCFQNFCMFNDAYAKEIVKLIIGRSDSHHTGWLGIFDNIFKN